MKTHTPLIWGLLDFGAFAQYVVWFAAQGQIPFYSELVESVDTARGFGLPLPILFSVVSIILYVTLLISGYLLIRRNSIGITISYVQMPFRLLNFIPPSIFFIDWPLNFGKGILSVNAVIFHKHAPTFS